MKKDDFSGDIEDVEQNRIIKFKGLFEIRGPFMKLCERFIVNIFAILYPYILMNSLLDVSNLNNTGFIKKVSCVMGVFFGLAAFKISLLFIIHSFFKQKGLLSKKEAGKEVNDLLFGTLAINKLWRAHAVFWMKRFILVMLVVTSTAYQAYISIILGFVYSLLATSFDLDNSMTNNKLEILYVVNSNAPMVIVSFVSMLMEGTYVSYNHKYITSVCMIVICIINFLLCLWLRYHDVRKVKPREAEKKRNREVEKLPSTFNVPSSTVGLKEKDLSVSEYSYDEDKDASIMSPNKSSFKGVNNGSGYENSSNGHGSWQKKLSNTQNSDTVTSKNSNFKPVAHPRANGSTPEDEGFSEESKEQSYSSSLPHSRKIKLQGKKVFKLPPV